MKVVISGGHLTPALAVINAFRTSTPKTKIIFIGREFSQEKERMRSREKDEMKKLRVPFYTIEAAKFHRTYFLRNFFELFRFIPSLYQAYIILKKERPNVFISFGGYLAVPIAFACKIQHIPLITHEQTRTIGLANQVIAHLASVIAISFEDSKKYFPKEKVILTGNPVRPSFHEVFRKKPDWLQEFPLNKPIVYITGGSQGSQVLNQTIRLLLHSLTKHVILIHQCGGSSSSHYIRELVEERNLLPTQQKKRYIVREWIKEEDVAWIFQHADLVVARSGANTVHEIMVSRVPAIFIPLPFAHMNEQLKNAQILEQKGAAIVIQQHDLIPKKLYETILTCLRKSERMQMCAAKIDKELVTDAAERIVTISQNLVARQSSIS
ncbi:MAG: UDP-N-acetylglucosamine--N-acetylmuramyl-(pentapeptide) pyrophosphoryl-undecaprenol N-acetylglucosamine transferase [Candidatus Pacebacteria bacterium]|nr:UDP-N-acetylglucosamine--N-acetylmuramyl-(pentapeptide) pyrophosphoryl-undecaprenol N-acetylglucosamine transferase [Candidatus Paceibacterota bacterium]